MSVDCFISVLQKWITVLTNLAKTMERVTMAMITIPVTAEDISKEETVKVVLKCYFLFRVYINDSSLLT